MISRCLPYRPRWYKHWPPLRHYSLSAFGKMPKSCLWALFRSPRFANCQLCPAGDGLGPTQRVPSLPPGAQRSASWSSPKASRTLLGLLVEIETAVAGKREPVPDHFASGSFDRRHVRPGAREILRRASARSREDLIDAIGGVLCAIRSQDACSYFEHVGYHPIAQLQ